MDTISDRVRRIIDSASDNDIQPADLAVLQSVLSELDESGAKSLLVEFFDVEIVTRGVYDAFVGRGHAWNADIRSRLAEALFFCGLDLEADAVLATIQ